MREELRQDIVTAVDEPMEGWCDSTKALAMAELILECKPTTIVEIGVFGGRSLIPQAMALRENGHGMIYGLDPWKKSVAVEGTNSKENDEWWLKLDLEYIHRHCIEHIWHYQLDSWATVIRSASQNCYSLFNAIDILHIDGAHSEVASVRDVVNYLPRMNHGGYIWFDDTDWTTTKTAVSMVMAECAEIKQVGSCKLFRKH